MASEKSMYLNVLTNCLQKYLRWNLPQNDKRTNKENYHIEKDP